jgi:ATP-dependent protease ClpP protease subunit
MNAAWIYTVDPGADEPIMLINNHIGFDSEDGMGIDGAQFQNELLTLDGMGKKAIQVWINSPGGSVMDGYNIYTAILKSKTKVDTHCTGMAASIAGVIFQAGRNRIMSDYGFLMYHNPKGPSDRKLIDMMTDSIAKMTARSGKTEADILKMMNKETFISSDEALEYGLCDSIEVSSESNKKRLNSETPVKAFYKEAQLVLNNIFNTNQNQNTMAFPKVANRLSLNTEASEDAIVNAIDRIENKAKEDKDSYEAKEKDLKDKMDKLKAEMEDLKKSKKDADDAKDKAEKDCKDAKEEVDKVKAEKKDAEDKGKEEEAKNYVSAYVKAGKIKNEAEAIKGWHALYVADPVFCKKQLESITLNKIGVKIETSAGETNENALTMVAAKAMADVRNRLEASAK